MQTTYSSARMQNDGGYEMLAVIGGVLAVDSAITTAMIAIVADSPVNLLQVFITATMNILGWPLAFVGHNLGLGFAFPRWVWAFLIVGWVGQGILFIYPLETVVNMVITMVVGGLIALGGLLAGGWGVERVVDTFVAITMMFSSGIAMTGNNPFNFTAPELGIVAFAWIILMIVTISGSE